MTAVIFTFPPDYLAACYAARALRGAGVRVVLAIDHADPVPAVEGCEVVQTGFDRRGNLNGKACVEGMLAVMETVSREEDEWVLKVDSDTLCFSTRWLEGREEDAVGLWHPGKRGFFGLCYALRRASLSAFRERASELEDADEMPEDETIYALAETVWRYDNRAEDRPMAAYTTERGWSAEEWRARREVIVVQRTEDRGRRDVSNVMRELLG